MTPSNELLQAKPIVKYLPNDIQHTLQLLCNEFSVDYIVRHRELWRCIDYVNYEKAADIVLTFGDTIIVHQAYKILKDTK